MTQHYPQNSSTLTGKDSTPSVQQGPEILVRNVHIRDVAELAVTMRKEDKDEIWHLARIQPLTALVQSVDASQYCKTVLLGSRVVCIFGVSHHGDGIGAPWMLASPLLKKIRKRFVRECKGYLEEMSKGLVFLTNVTWAENTEHHRWLKWLGFEFEEPMVLGPDGEKYIPFFKVVK